MSTSENIKQTFLSALQRDPELKKILKSIKENGGDYTDAEKYAARAGKLLTAALQANISASNFPVGSVSEIASLIVPAMELDYKAVSQVTGMVQKALNKDGGIGMNPIIPEFNQSAAYNLVGRMANYESFEDAAWMLEEPMQTASLGVVDDTLKKNADFQYKSGLRPRIIRTCESGACEWCQMLEGEYDYEEVKDRSNPVWQRHNNCECEITYVPGDGRAQDVESRQWLNEEAIQDRISKYQNMVRNQISNDSKRTIKLKYKLDNQFFAKTGKERAEMHAKNWEKASLSDAIQRFAPNPIITPKADGKILHISQDKRYYVIYDTTGNYFRIMDSQLKDEGNRRFVGLDGNDLNYYTDDGGNKVRRSKKQYDKLTHFWNSD